MDENEDIEQQLARLAAATDKVTASAGFHAKVFQALEPKAPGHAPSWGESIARTGKTMVLLSALVASAGVVFAMREVATIDDTSADSASPDWDPTALDAEEDW